MKIHPFAPARTLLMNFSDLWRKRVMPRGLALVTIAMFPSISSFRFS